MLTIIIPGKEYFNEKTNQFIYTKDEQLNLEHSLISITKWESKWHKPFLVKDKKTDEQLLDYIKCMTINKVSDDVYYRLTSENIKSINDYISDPMTATTFKETNKRPAPNFTTNEIIYWEMCSLNIPFECEKWNINRLLTLIRVCSEKNNESSKKKGSNKDTINHYAALNRARRAKAHK